jgi:hypothetical protein
VTSPLQVVISRAKLAANSRPFARPVGPSFKGASHRPVRPAFIH